MKFFYLIFTFVIVCCLTELTAQVKSYELVGTLKTENDQLVPFKLKFEVREDGSLHGQSETNFFSEDRTKSEISGKLDFKKQYLSFGEIRNLSTSSNANPNEFCYIRVDKLPWKKSVNKTIFNGRFTGFYPDSSICAKGDIYLVSIDMLKEFVDNNDALSGIKDSLKQHYGDSLTPISREEIIKEIDIKAPLINESKAVFQWYSSEIRINIWDNFEEDNDLFSIYVNDELRHQSEVATAFKKPYLFRFEGDSCTIRIVAENEGTRPPNTFQAQLVDSDKSRTLETKLKKGEFVEFVFIKAK